MIFSKNLVKLELSRRDFLRGATGAALAAGIAPAIVPALGLGQDGPRDPFVLWQQGALRGANVMRGQCTVEDLRVLRSWGANLAEIPVSNIYAPTPPYDFKPENMAALDQAVRAAEQSGLFAALTCREGPGRPDFERSHEIWRDASAQEAYAKMWAEVASHFRGRASMVGYDLMCEPHPDKESNQPLGDWNVLAKKITEAIRAVDERVPILVNSIGWAYPQQFDALRPTGDPRTVYTVHFYDPHYYTHQKPGENVTYPGFRLPDRKAEAWDKSVLEGRFAPVRSFQEKYQAPVFVGEFGCARYAPGVEEWLGDQMNFYEKNHWSWAYWAFREWDVMNIERTADSSDKNNHPDTPLLRLFKNFFAKDKEFLTAR
jgi:aryl-phospho-beta-D-glucosidase BglC (GH1 family)